MARQDKDGFIDPSLVAAWRRMLWLMRGSADVVEALVPAAAGMTKDEISRLLARAGAPSGKGVEPVEQVLGLLGVVPRGRYEELVDDYETLLKEYEELAGRVGEAEEKIERLRRLLREQGLVDEAEQLLDSWGGLVRRTLRAQAGFVRSIANPGGNPVGTAGPIDETATPDAGQRDDAPKPASRKPASSKAGPGKSTAPNSAAPKAAPSKSTAPKSAAPKAPPGKSTAPNSAAPKAASRTNSARSGRPRRPD